MIDFLLGCSLWYTSCSKLRGIVTQKLNRATLMVIQFRILSRRSSFFKITFTFLVVLPSPGNQGLLQNLAYYSMKHKGVATKLWIVL